MLGFVRNKLAQKELAELAGLHRKRATFRNFEDINKILLLADVIDIEQVKNLKRAANKFVSENKEVTIVVFYSAKELTDDMLVENGVHFLCLKDTNWKQLPELEVIPYIDKVPFDLVVDFSQEVSLQITKLAYVAQAPLIAGRDTADTFADFTIKIPTDKEETFLAEQIIFYLRTIKSK